MYARVGSMPPMTSATTDTRGSSRSSSKLSVRRPSAGVRLRGRLASRTRARTTETGRPTTRAMSSARAASSASTELPTVPYPSRPMPTGSLPSLASSMGRDGTRYAPDACTPEDGRVARARRGGRLRTRRLGGCHAPRRRGVDRRGHRPVDGVVQPARTRRSRASGSRGTRSTTTCSCSRASSMPTLRRLHGRRQHEPR